MGLFDTIRDLARAMDYDGPEVPSAYESAVDSGPTTVDLDLDTDVDTRAYDAFTGRDDIRWRELDYDRSANRMRGVVAREDPDLGDAIATGADTFRGLNEGEIPDSWIDDGDR